MDTYESSPLLVQVPLQAHNNEHIPPRLKQLQLPLQATLHPHRCKASQAALATFLVVHSGTHFVPSQTQPQDEYSGTSIIAIVDCFHRNAPYKIADDSAGNKKP